VKPQVRARTFREVHSPASAWVALVLLVLLFACSDGRHPRLAPGQSFPGLRLAGLDGGALDVGSLKGKVLVLNVWATWCPPCRREMPSLQRLSETVDRSRIVVAGITVDRDAQLAREYLLQSHISFANYTDSDMKIANGSLNVVGFPETFVVGPDGKLAARVAGAREWDSPETVRTLEALYRGEQATLR
jgi:thiol-disulfide isomerase/thioredoxin